MDLATLWNRHKAALHALRAGRSAAAVAAELGLPVCALEGLRPFTGASAPKGGQDSQALPLASPAPPGVLYPLGASHQPSTAGAKRMAATEVGATAVPADCHWPSGTAAERRLFPAHAVAEAGAPALVTL